MHERREPPAKGGLNGFEPTFAVDDVEAIASAVETAGGTITAQKSVIPTVGSLIRFFDTEGNDVGAMQYEQLPHT